MPTSPSEEQGPYDLAVVGAGPAGLAAAVTAARLGLHVALVDAASRVGGQFYRQPAAGLHARRPEALHHSWSAFARRAAQLDVHTAAGRIRHLAEHHVWAVTGEAGQWAVHAARGPDGSGETVVVRARKVLLATGAYERQLPFPGWTLPGVVGADGAQALLKGALVLPGRRVVVAGSGPLLLAVAGSLAAAGATVPVVVEASGYGGYARRPGVLAANPGKLAEGAVHAAALVRHGIRVRNRSAVTDVHGTTRVEAVTVTRLDEEWRAVPGTGVRIPCDVLAVGHGLLPQVELATGVGCATRRTPDGAHALVVDARQRTTVPGLWSAGETGGVGGAALAFLEGELAARDIGRSGEGAASLARRRDRLRHFGEAMAAAHAPGPAWPEWLRDDTEVCRCEEVTASRVREAVNDLGARDARTVKLLTRAGMGWCQGRMCGPAVACLAGATASPDRRPLACPVALGALAELSDG
ncbi:FAD/NAD(P)-dependent oxidoreductase [Streptomyces candidus]|uniref:NADPH-dependent 2,4-dienoyl-CoA reductase/sulfur reductase-like enzyme n=1 Tax=Streptomyces candidus TaxID=67283 RepID=A0A7X0LN07_9ACTN|nr:NAD(P)/FAD-dependent oxidoreductase [Streptomyces candidus]MBB6434352.1 NADPH-dependent 2,4-dienoyl-CoA reductase/sulfur reductase-like enzyme [Streptomyces candidus]GHH36974.1 oxidase [Streptomyces candidus]